jgi:hypothetical protein
MIYKKDKNSKNLLWLIIAKGYRLKSEKDKHKKRDSPGYQT